MLRSGVLPVVKEVRRFLWPVTDREKSSRRGGEAEGCRRAKGGLPSGSDTVRVASIIIKSVCVQRPLLPDVWLKISPFRAGLTLGWG